MGVAQVTRAFRSLALSIAVLIVGPKLFIEPGTKAIYPAFERERPRIVNNFAVERVARLRIAVLFREMNSTRPSNLAMRLEEVTNTQILTNRAKDYVCL
jgi:hypothetical protein